ncbi:WxPxxD family membrane protein [Peribacillus frigoritolerans]|uniref:WxPxxD family membrane protein n=1 Tax=Peribacillus frigoritolerans TaxID=450367 RepID=UPI000BECE517|nr:WxPxxD family membrane protein [Peribacillus frigoritolerans]MCR8872003.1 WxPxxD family membrane protein [Peribacillus frigoritolerans]PEF36905.1 hypothetical protein CON84_18645 [Bacillus sp. AFS094228]
MKTKIFISIIILFSLFSIVWYGQNIKYTSYPTFNSLLLMNSSAYGYNSLMCFSLFFTVPFLLFLDHTSTPENSFTVTRWLKREKLYNSLFKQLVTSSLLFTCVHAVVNIVFTSVYFDWELLNEVNFFLISFLNMIGLFFFYVWIGLIYRLIYDLSLSLGFSIFITYLIIAILFFMEKLYIPMGIWDPFKDLVIFISFLEHRWTLADIGFVYMRQLVLVFVLYMFGSAMFLRKDIIDK